MNNKIPLYITAVAGLTLIEITALLMGVDGMFMSTIVGAICLIVGIKIDPKVIFKRKKGK